MKLNLSGQELVHTGELGMCLLHGDYHVMDQGCWRYTLRFFFEYESRALVKVPAQHYVMRHKYLEQVERQILTKTLADVSSS
jgi:hypothetical protein